MISLQSFRNFTDGLHEQETPMPVLFIGHGSPMNGIADNIFSQRWEQMGKEIPVPKAVLVISAHWLTRGTHITAMEHPATIHDFGGFPPALHAVQYPAPGDPALAKATRQLITKTHVGLDHDWGLDHGSWTVVRRMYPAANIPVLQLSIDYHQPPAYHYELARELAALRKKGVLITGIRHSLRLAKEDVETLLRTRGLRDAVRQPKNKAWLVMVGIILLSIAVGIYFYSRAHVHP